MEHLVRTLQRHRALALRPPPDRAAAWSITAMSLTLLVGGVSPALGQTQPVDPVEQGATPMDKIDMSEPQPTQPVVPSAKPQEGSAFINDSKFGGELRSFYFNRGKYDDTHSEAWALGGFLSYQSGYLANLLRFGAVAYTSLPLYAPDDRDGTLLLKPGQEGYFVLGQIYGEIKLADGVFGAFGRKEYDTPYIAKHDVRMTPNTFEGATVYGKMGGKDGAPELRFGGGYISKIKEKNSDEFKWMSTVAGAGVDRGVFLGGANYAQKEFSVGAIDYYSDDIINIFYTEAKYFLPLAPTTKLSFAGQYTDQRSTGNNLLTGSEFSTGAWALKSDLTLGATVLTLAYSSTRSGSNMFSPWSGYPGYTAVQVKDFNRANEKAVMVKGGYDFSALGAKGLSAYALYVNGSGVNAPLFNEREADFNVQYALQAGALRGTSFRMRYAHITQKGGGDPTINDFRLIVNYDF